MRSNTSPSEVIRRHSRIVSSAVMRRDRPESVSLSLTCRLVVLSWKTCFGTQECTESAIYGASPHRFRIYLTTYRSDLLTWGTVADWHYCLPARKTYLRVAGSHEAVRHGHATCERAEPSGEHRRARVHRRPPPNGSPGRGRGLCAKFPLVKTRL